MTDTLLPTTPENPNLLHSDKFRFTVRNLPNVSFFCTEATVPGVAHNLQTIGNAINRLQLGGTKVTFNELQLTFRVDEDLKNFKEIYNWIIGIGSPETFSQFKNLVEQNSLVAIGRPKYEIYSDATLLTLTNSMNVNVNLTFHNLFPLSLGDIQLNEQASGDAVVASATFAYLNYDFNN